MNGCTTLLRQIYVPDRGASSLEYAGLIILAASIVIALVTAGSATQVGDLLSRAVGCVTGSAQCADPGESESDPTASDGDEDGDTGGPAPDSDQNTADPGSGGEPVSYNARGEEDDGPRRSYECGWFQRVCDWGQGAASEAGDIAAETWEGAQGTACLVHVCNNEDFRATWGGVRDSTVQWFTDPAGAAEDAAHAWADGPLEDYNHGYDDRSTGRTIVLSAASVFGFGLARNLPNIPESGSTRGHRQNAETAAVNGNASAAERHADLAEQAAQESETAARANPDDFDLQEQARRDRDNADEARKTVPVAQAKEDFLSTDTGRELNRVLSDQGIMIVFEDMPDHHAMYERGNDTVVIDSRYAGTPEAAAHLAHETSHAQNSSNLPTHQEASRDEYVAAHLEDEADAHITGFQVANELREQGHDVPTTLQERRYNALYEDRVELFEEQGHSTPEAEQRARESAREVFMEQVADMGPQDGPTYREKFEGQWDDLTGN